jgi:hypothetical protein
LTIAALISGGGGILSSIFGGMSESQQANQQNALNAQQLADQKLGSTDARGNSTKFVPGKGWVTSYGPTDQMLEDYFLAQELPARQDQFQRADTASRAEDVTAKNLLSQFNSVQREYPNDIYKMLYAAASNGIGENTSEAMSTALRSALRSGTSNVGKITEGINKAGSDALATAGLNAKLQALDYADNKYASDRGDTSSLYNLFASRARGDLAPTTGAGGTTTTSSVGSQQYSPAVADNGLANALGGAASALSGTANTLAANSQNSQTNALLKSFLEGSGMGSIATGGIGGSVSDRTKISRSTF